MELYCQKHWDKYLHNIKICLPKPTDFQRCLDFLFKQISNEFKQGSTTCSKKIGEMIQSSLVLVSMFVKSLSFFCLTKSRSLFFTPRQWMMNVMTWKRRTKVSMYPLILSFHIKFSHIPHISLTYPWILKSQPQKCLFCVVVALQLTVFYWQGHKQQKFSNKTINNAQIAVIYPWHITGDFHISRQMWKLQITVCTKVGIISPKNWVFDTQTHPTSSTCDFGTKIEHLLSMNDVINVHWGGIISVV